MRTIKEIERMREIQSVQSEWQSQSQEDWPHDRRFCVVGWTELHQILAASDVMTIHYSGNCQMDDGKFYAMFAISYKEDRDRYHSILTGLNLLAVQIS